MRFSAEDIKRQMEAQSPIMNPNQTDPNTQNLIAGMVALPKASF
jgi:hypothetical protein